MRRRHVYLILGSAAALIFVAIYAVFNGIVETTVIRTEKSPDGAWTMSVFSNDCGAPCSRQVHGIALARKMQTHFSRSDMIFTKVGVEDLDAHWIDAHTLAVTGSTDFTAPNGLQKKLISDITIIYPK